MELKFKIQFIVAPTSCNRIELSSIPSQVLYLSWFYFGSVNDTKSFKNVTCRWIPELRHFCPDAPLILVATKTDETYSEDCQVSPGESPLTRKQGRQLAKRIHVRLFTFTFICFYLIILNPFLNSHPDNKV